MPAGSRDMRRLRGNGRPSLRFGKRVSRFNREQIHLGCCLPNEECLFLQVFIELAIGDGRCRRHAGQMVDHVVSNNNTIINGA